MGNKGEEMIIASQAWSSYLKTRKGGRIEHQFGPLPSKGEMPEWGAHSKKLVVSVCPQVWKSRGAAVAAPRFLAS